jgi:hypothetical protein
MRRALPAVVCLAGLSVAGAAEFQVYTAADAERTAQKLNAIVERGGQEEGSPAAPLRTALTEHEVTSYLAHTGPELLPAGVRHARISLLDDGRVETRATVDLDAVRGDQPRKWTDPLAYVGGTLDIHAVGRLRAAAGKGRFELEQATFGGVRMPKAFLQEVVSYYSRTESAPRGFQLDDPFDLPLQIRQVELRRGSAVIVQ